MNPVRAPKSEKKTVVFETLDCGFGIRMETHDFFSVSINKNELSSKKPIHKKLHSLKNRVNKNKERASFTIHDRKLKKNTKTGKRNTYVTLRYLFLKHSEVYLQSW